MITTSIDTIYLKHKMHILVKNNIKINETIKKYLLILLTAILIIVTCKNFRGQKSQEKLNYT